MVDDDAFWLSVPQAVVLDATHNIEVAVGLTAETPILLIAKANQLVARRIEVPLPEDADEAMRVAAIKKFQEIKVAALADSRYLEAQRRIVQCVIAGVTTKARRRPGGPYESIDKVEYTATELQGFDAIDKRTRDVILFDLRIEARELAARLIGPLTRQVGAAGTSGQALEDAPREGKKWERGGDPVPKLIEWAQSRWGKGAQGLPNSEGLLTEFRNQFGHVYGVNEKTMRAVRGALASPKMRRGGAPTHRRNVKATPENTADTFPGSEVSPE